MKIFSAVLDFLKKHKKFVIILFLPVPAYILVDNAVFILEKDNRFCIACHLHEEKYKDFTASGDDVKSLVGRHYSTKEVRCIDCHKGEGVLERAMVLGVAGVDTFVYFLGMHEEPEEMRFPLTDRTCLKCHEDDMVPKGSYSSKYHELTPHANLAIRCAKCHISHIKGGARNLHFLVEDLVLPICRDCHPSMFD